MAKLWTVAVVGLAAVGVCLTALVTTAAPAPPVQPVKTTEKWEYCEISASRSAIARPGGVGAVQPAQAMTTVRWVTPEEEVEATGWDDLAAKMKAPEAKKDASAAVHKMRVLNHMGSQGWELVSHTQTSTAVSAPITLVFKRKVSK